VNNIITLLPRLVEAAAGNSEIVESAAKIAWSRAVGDGIRSNAAPLRLDDHKLVIAVADAIWQTQLKAMSAELLARINRLLGRDIIKSLDFRIDPRSLQKLSRQTARATFAATERATVSVPVEVLAAAGEIQDEALRQRFLAAAGSVIARRESKAVEQRYPREPGTSVTGI
jgi:hypothetical protein